MNVNDIQKIKNTFVRPPTKVVTKVYFDGERITTDDGESTWESREHAEKSLMNHFMLNSHLIGIDSSEAYKLLCELEQGCFIEYLTVYSHN